MLLVQTAGWALALIILCAVLLVSCESKIVYHPYKYPEGNWDPAPFDVTVEDVNFQAEDGTQLHGWYIPSPNAQASMLWFHGNAGNLTHRLQNIQKLKPLNLNIFIFDYRGYGKSQGSPNEKGIYQDSQAAYDILVREKNVSPQKLILFGRSLGGVCAIEVASSNPAAGLILESTFTSARDMAGKVFPLLPIGWAIQSKFDALEKVPRLKLPKLFLHGTEDEVVPYEFGRKLFDAAAEPKEFYDIQGAGHNDTVSVGGVKYFAALDRFITKALEEQRSE
ncbi:MAG: alpha/beta hydrolase [Nitrospinaceae bacterium]|nr:MAG: alpha/beta hydrolase [Nitrospinaceae bacterium]